MDHSPSRLQTISRDKTLRASIRLSHYNKHRLPVDTHDFLENVLEFPVFWFVGRIEGGGDRPPARIRKAQNMMKPPFVSPNHPTLLTRIGVALVLVAIVCSAEVALCAAPADGSVGRPNIVIVMPDDVGYGDFSCHGNPVIHTPQVDAFYRQSVRFTDFHVSPLCSPTRCALMTGRHEFKSGVTHTILERERMSLKAVTIAQVLEKSGYATGIFGKWHLGDEAPYQPDRRGFEEVFIHGGGGIGQTFPGSCGDAPGNTYFNPAILHNGTFEKTHGYCTNVFFQQALRWIDRERKGGRHFFAYITPNAAHTPLQVPDDYFQRHRGQVADNVARFFGMIENIDDNFGTLLKKLDDWGLANNTLVVFLTDNGGTQGTTLFNAGMRGTKATPYQGGTRVPSFWRWPAAFAGGRDVSVLTDHIDIFPTLAEVARAKLSDPNLSAAVQVQVEGRSLVNLLEHPGARFADRYLMTHCGHWPLGQAAKSKYTNCSIRNARFTLVNNVELYDLQKDPGERTNVLAQHPEVVAALRDAYDRWWKDVFPRFENENVIGPNINPFKDRYWKQFGGGPDAELLRRMKPGALRQ
jgi:arylsulfatase A-like enzyme